jgi:hypothetical protein
MKVIQVYEATDGTRFDYEGECLYYEDRYKLLNFMGSSDAFYGIDYDQSERVLDWIIDNFEHIQKHYKDYSF